MRPARREARLRREYRALYAGVPVEEWRPIGELLDCVKSARLRGGRRSGEFLSGRQLDDRHFEFRGGEEGRPADTRTRTRVSDVPQQRM